MRTDTKWVYQTHPLPLGSAAPVVAIVLVGWEFGLLRLSCVGVVRIVMAADAKKKKKTGVPNICRKVGSNPVR